MTWWKIGHKQDLELLPWAGKIPIYEFIKQNLGPDGCLIKENDKLPDDEEFFEGKPFRWVSGGMDGAFGHHSAGSSPEKRALRLVKLLRKQVRKPENSCRRATYVELMKDDLVGCIDEFINSLRNLSDLDLNSLFNEALWFATKGAHRGVVKAGIALLGMFDCEEHCEVLMTLGKHEEFTLYASVAITNGMKDSNQNLFQLAKCLNGWGKIHLVERLEADTNEVKDWLLRDGCENSVMNEYLAFICATKGNLKDELSHKTISYDLYIGAGTIIEALINGGPAEDMDDYEDSRDVIVNFLRHSEHHVKELKDLLVITKIKDFLEEDEERRESRYQSGWDKKDIPQLLGMCNKLIEDKDWESLIWSDIDSSDKHKHYCAVQSARALGLDIWPKLFSLLSIDPINSNLYYQLMRTNDKERIKKLIEFATENLPLDTVVGEPRDDLGLGTGFEIHHCLDFILQDLDNYAGIGQDLIMVGLRSTLVRNRNMALKALEAWAIDFWPRKSVEVLTNLVKSEPNGDTKKKVEELLSVAKANR